VVMGYLPHTTAVLWSPARTGSLPLPRRASTSRQVSGLCSSLSRLFRDAYLPGIADRSITLLLAHLPLDVGPAGDCHHGGRPRKYSGYEWRQRRAGS